MEESKTIQDFTKERLSLDEGWWFDFLLGAALAQFACGEYRVETTKTDSDIIE